jgi:hypothetical protein
VPDDNLYLNDAVEQMMVGIETLTDSDGDDIAETVRTFLFPYPTGSNWICAHTASLSRQEKPAGSPHIEQTWGVPVRIGVGNIGQELGGIQQTKLWERLPIVINWITEHPHLQYAGNTELPTYLDTTIGVKVQPGAANSRVEQTETGHVLWTEIIVQIPFRIPITLIKYQDGQLIEVT